MLLKTIIKLILVSIGVIILNISLNEMYLCKFNEEEVSWANSFIYFLNSYSIQFKGITLNIVISIIGFIGYVVYDYYRQEEETLIQNIGTDSISILIGNFVGPIIFGLLLIFLLLLQIILKLVFFIPYEGWLVMWHFIKHYNTFYELPKITELDEQMIQDISINFFIVTLIFLFILLKTFSISKFKNKNYNDTSSILNYYLLLILNSKFCQSFYLFYLTPSIIVLILPVLLSWFGLTQEKSPISLNILSSIFLLGLLLVIFKINKNNRKIKRELLKEEIKKEVMDEIGKN